ncbi:MAG: peroxiredoxin family protein [Flavobacteriia bacterium]|jgi:thiol-disulfide isomerase/thioredoxin
MRYIPFLLSLIVLFSCGEQEEEANQEDQLKQNFSVSGTIEGAGNSPIYLEALSQQGTISVAQSTVEANGAFKMVGNIPGMGIYQLRLGEANDKIIPLTLSPDEHVKIRTNFTEYATKPAVSGTTWADVMNRYMDKFGVFAKGQMELNALEGKITEEEMMIRFLAIKKPIDEFARAEMRKDPANAFNIVLSTATSPNMGFKDWDPANLEVLKLVAEAYKKKYKDSPMAATMENQVFQIENAFNEYKNSISAAPGAKTAPEIAMKNTAGKILKLSSLRGKIVLIDFWASWCGPCRRENPNVVKLYNKYKDKGFTVFSVSLDSDADAWKKAITQDGLIWPNHVSDLLGWQTPMTQLYGFNSIPHTVLIDKNGKILGVGLRGEILEQKLKELIPN